MSAFDYSKVTNIYALTESAYSIKKINMGNFNALELEDASFMLWGADAVEEIIFTSISTPKLKNAQQMISTLTKVKRLDMSGLTVTEDANLYCMFCGLSSLEFIDLSSMETTGSQTLSGMFSGTALTTGYAKRQEDADRFNNKSVTSKPDTVTFVVKPTD